jgi:inosine-uridine nucleoside N-ribohydrolase
MKSVSPPGKGDRARERRLQPPVGPVRLIIDTDAHNEIDDQFALTWALLSPERLRIEAILAVPYSFARYRGPLNRAFELMRRHGSRAALPADLHPYRSWAGNLLEAGMAPGQLDLVGPEEGMELSCAEIVRVMDRLQLRGACPVLQGSRGYMSAARRPQSSPAAEYLIDRALHGGPEPLYVAAIGCATNVASALLMEPAIIDRIIVLWTSGYPSYAPFSNEASFNLVQDVHAARLLFESGVALHYLPGFHVGAQLRLSLPEVERWVRGRGAIGDYLYRLFENNPIHAQRAIRGHFGRSWVIWDLINIAWLLNPEWVPSRLVNAPRLGEDLCWRATPGGHLMREAWDVDRDAIFRDFFSRLEAAP